jgi:hypothetical protein
MIFFGIIDDNCFKTGKFTLNNLLNGRAHSLFKSILL